MATWVTGTGLAAPVIDPIASVTIPAGKSLILPVTATNSSGRPLTYTVASSTPGIAAILHTNNNPFWQLSVAQAADPSAPGAYSTPFRDGTVTVTNVGNLTFMLFPEYAPHTVNVFQGLTTSGFFNSNTIFHSVVTNYYIQGGDPMTNGSGSLVFTYDDEYHPEAMFTGNGQLALANARKNANGSQFFITSGAQRGLDFSYPLFGQLVRGFEVLTNVLNTAVEANNRPLADVIILQADYVTDTTDTVLTLTATNVAGLHGTITLIAADSAGGRATNTFAATTVTDTNSNNQTVFYPNSATNLVAPENVTLTNFLHAIELDGEALYWYPSPNATTSYDTISNSVYYTSKSQFKTLTYNVQNTNGTIDLLVRPSANYTGPATLVFDVSSGYNPNWYSYQYYGVPLPPYAERVYTFVFGDTPVSGQSNRVAALATVPFTNGLLATFTNGVPHSAGANFTAVINWGDDTTNSGGITANAAGRKAVLGSHTYAYPGSYPVYVQMQSVKGASDTILSFVNVTNQASPATNLFTVRTSGPGTVSPDYTNAPLAVGASYSLSAAPSNNCFLTSWTDTNGFVLGTGANLTFTMSPGLSLTANFALITPPTLTLVAPLAGRVLTNLYSAPATIVGTASNTAPVTAVYVQANSNGWQTASGTTAWTANFLPVYGVTNVIQAYAVNIFGYVSATNVLRVKYLAGDILQLATNGLGTITPNLNGHLLPLGTNYALTVAPAAGFVFTNWTVATNWVGGWVTNRATVQFTMATNLTLQANLVETNRPALSLNNLVAGQRVSNAVFTVQGKASDNWQVVAVNVQVNNGGWTNAAGTTAWSAPLNLIPGPNTVQAYAVGRSGNVSATNSVNFIYVPSAVLNVHIVGQGTLTPNDNGALLALGGTYSMKATGINGFAFYHWTVGVTMTTNSTLTFTMATNLTITANFVDVTKPLAMITYPAANQKWTNAVITATGKASDNAGVAEVWCQINLGGWALAQTSNGFTNWTATNLPVIFGTNLLQAYAVDAAGNLSATNPVKFLGLRAPASLAGYQGTLTPSGGGKQKVVVWGANTWSQTGAVGDTNADDYCAGSYAYFQTGAITAVLSNLDLGMFSALGTTNSTTVNMTFTNATTAKCTWTNADSSGAGTVTFLPVDNLAPATLGGMTVQIHTPTGAWVTGIAFANDGTFTKTNVNASYYGTYTFTQYSPVAAVIELNHTDPNENGAEEYLEFDFTSATAGEGFGSYYASPAYGSNPDNSGLGTFTIAPTP